MADSKGLKGFSNLGAFPNVVDTAAAYSAGGTKIPFVGASACEIADNKKDFSIPGDDGVYDSGSDWTDTTVTPTIHEISLDALAALAGSTYDKVKEELEESTFDIPYPVALTFSALRRDGGYRLYRYYVCKLQSYSVSHSTKGVSNDGQPYKLVFKALPRKIDGRIRNTHDIAKGDPLTWLDSIPSLPAGAANADLSALSLGSLTLSPAFSAATNAYTTSTANATNTITATAADINATIAITVGSTPVTNGQAATWATGDNTVTITVTNGSTINTYTVTVTKS